MKEGNHPCPHWGKTLCDTEKVLLVYLGKGYQPKEIASLLGIHPQTVKNRMATIREKLDAHTTIEAVYAHFVEGKGVRCLRGYDV